jgi:hypothetical protein
MSWGMFMLSLLAGDIFTHMKTKRQVANRPNRKLKVIVRSWGDEPVVLFLYSADTTRLIVGRRKARYTIGLPAEQVFPFHKSVFHNLADAWAAGDRDKLASLYAEIIVNNNACNRYQDALNSVHDKKHITDSRSVASSSQQ